MRHWIRACIGRLTGRQRPGDQGGQQAAAKGPILLAGVSNVRLVDLSAADNQATADLIRAYKAEGDRQAMRRWVRYTVCATLDAANGGDHDEPACGVIAKSLYDRVRGNRPDHLWEPTRADKQLLVESAVRWANTRLADNVPGRQP